MTAPQSHGNRQALAVEAVITWKGEEDRELKAYRYCGCGTCQAARPAGSVGYLSGSNSRGDGFTVRIFDEAEYQALADIFGSGV